MKSLFSLVFILALVSMALALDVTVAKSLDSDVIVSDEYQDVVVAEATNLSTFNITDFHDIDIGFDVAINTNYFTNNGFEIHKDNVNFVPEKRIRDVIKPKSNVNYFRSSPT